MWPRESGTISFYFFCFFPSYIVMFVQIEANQGDEAKCGLVGFSLGLQAFQAFLGLATQIHHLPFSTLYWALSTLQKHYILKQK